VYTVGICDREKHICSYLENLVLQCGKEKDYHFETYIFGSSSELCEYLRKGNQLDIIFLDIELLDMTGIQVGSFIRNQLEDRFVQIIYISENSNYAGQLFKTQPLDFLIKPIKEEVVFEVLALADKVLRRKNTVFRYQQGKDYFRVPYDEIMYFISDGRKMRIITKSGVKEFYGKLQEIVFGLPKDFLLIHKSYAVNISFVRRYAYEEIELIDGTKLTISKSCRKQVRQKILRLWTER